MHKALGLILSTTNNNNNLKNNLEIMTDSALKYEPLLSSSVKWENGRHLPRQGEDEVEIRRKCSEQTA
jgi:hypothetical protein